MSVPDPLTTSLTDELFIFSMGFGPDGVEVDFLDPRRQSEGLNEVTKLGIDRSLMRDQIEEIEELIRDLVDETLRTRRK